MSFVEFTGHARLDKRTKNLTKRVGPDDVAIIVHAYRDGDAPGAARLDRLGLPYHVVRVPGISEDSAFLLAYEKGAQLIVAVGTHFNLVEFLERDRQGMSSTIVRRLKVGDIHVNTKSVSWV